MLAVFSACQGRHLCRPDPPKASNESKQMLSQEIICVYVCLCLDVCACVCVPEWLIKWLAEESDYITQVILCCTRWTTCKRQTLAPLPLILCMHCVWTPSVALVFYHTVQQESKRRTENSCLMVVAVANLSWHDGSADCQHICRPIMPLFTEHKICA